MIVINGDGFTEDKRVPWNHVALRDGWTPFDVISWKEDQDYRKKIQDAYLAVPPGNLGFCYLENVADFVHRSQVVTAYRAIRIRSQAKKLANELAEVAPIDVPPDGGNNGLFDDIVGVMKRMSAYQRLQQWPQGVPLTAVNPFASALPIQHVSGDNYATQYISCAAVLDRARFCSLTSYATGTARIRAAYEWSPVVQIDLSRLGGECQIVDLRTAEARIRAGFFPSDGRSHPIGANADQDQEILITGRIPSSAVVKVYDAVSTVKMEQDQLYQDAIQSRSFKQFSATPDFQHLAAILS